MVLVGGGKRPSKNSPIPDFSETRKDFFEEKLDIKLQNVV